MFKGKEIVRLMVIGALCCLVMIASISVYLVVSSRQHLESQAEKMTEALGEAIALNLDTSFDRITGFLKETPAIPLSTEAWKILTDTKRVIGFFTGCAYSVYNCDYAVELDQGEIYVGYADEAKGLSVEGFPMEVIEGKEVPTAESGLEVVNDLQGREGTFIMLYRDIDVPTVGRAMTIVLIIDVTDQANALSESYNADKSSMVKKQAIVSAVIFLVLLLLSIVVIYFAIKRSLSDPIDAINSSARSIVSGQKGADIEPEEKSIFHNLQMLLRSGQVILEKSRPEASEGGDRDGE